MSAPTEEQSEIKESTLYILKQWFLNSPSHGIRRISHANSIAGSLFWSITFIGFTILMCVFISSVIVKYIEYPTKINLSIRQHRDPNHFPAVTFCNLNPLRNEKFLGGNSSQKRKLSDIDRFNTYMSDVLFNNVINKRPESIKSGYTLNDLLIECTFNGRSCHRNLTLFLHPNYGNCYTFNNDLHVDQKSQKKTAHFWSIDDEDDEDGYRLVLELYLYQHEYIEYLDDRAAFRIFIHRKHEIPILSQNSLFLAPTTFTKLIFSQRIISFSQQCRNDLTDDMKEIFRSNHIRYSQALCFKLCEFRYIETHCQCIDRLFMVFFQFFTRNQTTNTKVLCENDTRCLSRRERFNSRKSCPECLPECQLVQYTIQSSYADYPNERATKNVLERIEKHIKKTGYSVAHPNTSVCTNNRRQILLDDIVAVGIAASPYATETLSESPMYTWVDLISSIGGQTGLWIGVSLISFVEIAELVFLLIRHFIKTIYQLMTNKPRVVPITH